MSCEHDCDRPPIFPADIFNRPGLTRFNYRIGTYAKMRAHMLDGLVKDPALTGWTHLGPDEPGIALLEGSALIGDILTFYQQLYGNETKLGTAAWSESVSDLIRLTGYRLAPGLGGAAVFALEIDATDPVIVPAGFPFEAQLEDQDAPSVFESTDAVEAFPAFNEFHLYRPRLGLQPIAKGTTNLDIFRLGTAEDLATRAEVDLNEGDRVMIFSGAFDAHEILIVSSVEEHLDRVTIQFDAAVQETHPGEVTAFKVDRTFRHYGADAPRQFTTFQESPPKVDLFDTVFDRPIAANSSSSVRYSGLGPRQMPLDQEVDDLAVGGDVICVGRTSGSGGQDFVLQRRIERIIPREVTWANVTAPVTMLRLNASLQNFLFEISQAVAVQIQQGPQAQIAPAQISQVQIAQQQSVQPLISSPLFQQVAVQGFQLGNQFGSVNAAFDPLGPGVFEAPEGPASHDIRRLRIYETLGERMVLRAPPKQKTGAILDGRVNFFGTRQEAKALADRRLLLSGLTETPQQIMVSPDQPELAASPPGPPGDRRMWPIQLSSLPEAGASGFSESDPAVTVYGNLVDATQGESQPETVIGSGDARAEFQTFALPKDPLTFLPDPVRTPPRRAELEIRVAGRLWTPVETFFDRPADAEIYVIRQDNEGKDIVQFGDGKNGARLPSGRNNITAAYRTGYGARGDLETNAEAKAKGKLKPLTGVEMPGPATGGADPETMDTARVAAPGRMQSLGRLVGLSDYEAEALAIAGVLKAGATFGTGMAAAIDLTILTEDESETSVAAVEAALRSADRCRGPARHPLNVVSGRRRYAAVTLQLGYDPVYRSEDLDAAVHTALGALPLLDGDAPGDGVFSLKARRFGQDVHVSQAVAAAQQVVGVIWVRPVTLRLLPATSDDPADIQLPANPLLHPRLLATPQEVLALSAHHLVLDSVMVTSDEECPQ